jgi:hypothetical protein
MADSERRRRRRRQALTQTQSHSDIDSMIFQVAELDSTFRPNFRVRGGGAIASMV